MPLQHSFQYCYGIDKLSRVKPLFNDVRLACQAHYHPHQQLAVDERMVKSKANTGMRQYMKDKPTKWGMKFFVLALDNISLEFNIS